MRKKKKKVSVVAFKDTNYDFMNNIDIDPTISLSSDFTIAHSGCSNVVVSFDVSETTSQNFDVDTHNSLCDVDVCAPNSTIHFHGNNLPFTLEKNKRIMMEKIPI